MKILFASDMGFNHLNNLKGFPGSDKVKEMMRETAAEFRKADFSMLNLENILGEREAYTPIVKSGPNLISPYDFIEFVDELAPTAVGLANNHCCDYGERALLETMELLRSKGYQMAGAGKNIDEAYVPAVFEKDGVKVAVITICENEPGYATANLGGGGGYNLYKTARAIYDARDKGMLPVIYFHGGNEQNPFPSPEKTQLYRHFIDIGAKAVIAMHTHCPQGYEMYNGSPIVYSMGNFFFLPGKEKDAAWYHGYMTMLDINNENISIEVIPYRFDFDGHYILKGEEKENFMKYLNYLSDAIQDEKRISEYFDSWCIIVGMGYMLNWLNYTPEILNDAPKSIVALKNVLGCEAHNELLRNTLSIIYEGRIKDAEKHIDEIKRLQKMELV